MNASSPLTRRALITTVGTATVATASALVLAACSPSGAGTGSGGADSASTGPNLAAGTTLALLADVPVGGTKAASIDGEPVLLAQPTSGTVVCFSAICPHQGCTVAAAGKEYDCPCHGSSFVAATGAVISGPAVTGLTAIKVTVSGPNIVTA